MNSGGRGGAEPVRSAGQPLIKALPLFSFHRPHFFHPPYVKPIVGGSCRYCAVFYISFWQKHEKRERQAVPKIGPPYGTIFWQHGAVTALFRATPRWLLRGQMLHTTPAEVMRRRGSISSTWVAFLSQGLGGKMEPFWVPDSGPQIGTGFRPRHNNPIMAA